MNTREEQIQIANTIISQMGGYGKLKAMVGMNDQVALESGLRFSFKGNPKMNRCEVKLNGMDTYDVAFYKIPRLSSTATSKQLDKYFEKIEQAKTPVKEVSGCYNDMLKPVFEETTGLYLSL